MSPVAYVAAAVVMFFGAAIQGAIGFGSNLIAAPLLVLIDPRFVPGPVTVSSFVLNLTIIRTRRHERPDPRVAWALIGLVPGTVAAGAVLSALPVRTLSITFAGLVLLAVGLSASGLSLRRTRSALIGAGALAGFMGTVSGIGGPPIALPYQHEPPALLRATLPRFFMVGGVLGMITLACVGRLGADEFLPSLALMPGVAVGIAASHPLARHLDRRHARPYVLAISFLSAVAVLVRELG